MISPLPLPRGSQVAHLKVQDDLLCQANRQMAMRLKMRNPLHSIAPLLSQNQCSILQSENVATIQILSHKTLQFRNLLVLYIFCKYFFVFFLHVCTYLKHLYRICSAEQMQSMEITFGQLQLINTLLQVLNLQVDSNYRYLIISNCIVCNCIADTFECPAGSEFSKEFQRFQVGKTTEIEKSKVVKF